jgi:hypothetical protein
MRWYDVEPDVYMAISMIECSELPKQIEYAKLIINNLREKDSNMEYIKNTTIKNLSQKYYKRWYDKNDTISMAFEYLKNSTRDIQIEVAKEVLSYINIQAAINT